MKKIMNALDKSVFFVSVTTIILVTVILFIFPEQSKAAVDRLMHFMTYRLGFLYIMSYVLLVVFLIWLVFSQYGKVVLGKSDDVLHRYCQWSDDFLVCRTNLLSGVPAIRN